MQPSWGPSSERGPSPSHFTAGKTKEQRHEVTTQGSHSQKVEEVGFEPKYNGAESLCPSSLHPRGRLWARGSGSWDSSHGLSRRPEASAEGWGHWVKQKETFSLSSPFSSLFLYL